MVPGHHDPSQNQRGDACATEYDGFFAPFAEAPATLDLPLEVDRSRSTAGLAGAMQIPGQFVIDGGGCRERIRLLLLTIWIIQVNHVPSPFP
ncbi:hypothetical protein [Acidithiobacillus ferrooxidans]|uniref:hypothetical protein n=1 Tax=Acidithiobacillus ferrooxidans TaxID=920 RepID=UPI001C075259|nr:hypothetical protein [Acidithiobacillus ferrooxidans]